MDLESSNFNTPQNKPENESTTNAFLREQIRLPKEQWSPKFRALVQKEFVEIEQFMEHRRRIRDGEETETEESPEIEREHTFHRYLEELGLHEEELRGKRVMDLGFGDGRFVKHLIAKGITSEAYGIDIYPNTDSRDDGFQDHLFEGSFEDNLPVQDLDYILSIHSIAHDYWEGNGGDYVMNVENVLEKSLSALKEGGEMRIFPIEECAKEHTDQKFKVYTVEIKKKWDALLLVMSKKYGITYEVEPRKIFVSPVSSDVTLQSVLIIQKQFRG